MNLTFFFFRKFLQNKINHNGEKFFFSARFDCYRWLPVWKQMVETSWGKIFSTIWCQIEKVAFQAKGEKTVYIITCWALRFPQRKRRNNKLKKKKGRCFWSTSTNLHPSDIALKFAFAETPPYDIFSKDLQRMTSYWSDHKFYANDFHLKMPKASGGF